MMRATLAFACLLGLAAPAAAKEQPLPPVPDDLSIQVVHNFAACVADTTPRGAKSLLAMDYRDEAYKKALARLAQGHEDGRCMNASILRSNYVLISGGLAERLLIGTVKPERFASLVAYDAAKASIEARGPLELTSICVVRAEPDKTFAIFRTEPTSTDEGHAMQAIAPTLMNCIKAGQKIAFNKPGLRALLALASYRLVQPGPIASAAAKPIVGEPGSR